MPKAKAPPMIQSALKGKELREGEKMKNENRSPRVDGQRAARFRWLTVKGRAFAAGVDPRAQPGAPAAVGRI